MKLYHGSNVEINEVDLSKCRPFKDFGVGFYTTMLEEQKGKTPIIFKDTKQEELASYIILNCYKNCEDYEKTGGRQSGENLTS